MNSELWTLIQLHSAVLESSSIELQSYLIPLQSAANELVCSLILHV